MDDWFGNLLGELAYSFIAGLLWVAARKAYQEAKRLEGSYGKHGRVTLGAANPSVVTIMAQKLTGGGTEGHAGSVGETSLSAAEELFWWYWRIRLS